MRISSTLSGVEIWLESITDPALQQYAKSHGRVVKGSAGFRVKMSWQTWYNRPGVTTFAERHPEMAGSGIAAAQTALRDGPALNRRKEWPPRPLRTAKTIWEAGARDDA